MKKLLIFAFAIIAMCSCTSKQSCPNDNTTVDSVQVDSVDSVQVDSISGFNCAD